MLFQKLQTWQDSAGRDDDWLAGQIGVHRTTIYRAKRGLRLLGMDHQLALQKITKIPPSEWADFYAQTVHLRPKKTGQAQKKSLAAEVAS